MEDAPLIQSIKLNHKLLRLQSFVLLQESNQCKAFNHQPMGLKHARYNWVSVCNNLNQDCH